jgi:putative ABC transport system permease protein
MSFSADLRLALRSLRRQPLFAFTVVAILAVAIAANTAVFSLVNGLMLEPLPFPDPARVVDLNERAPQWNLERTGVAYPDIHAWRAENRTFDGIAPWNNRSFNLSSDTGTERVRGIAVGHNFAEVVGYEPMLGRDFTEADDRPGAERVVILGHGLWQRQFGADRDVFGQTLRLDTRPYTVIGVLPADALFPQRADLWVPLGLTPEDDDGWYLAGIGRLADGVSTDQALADLERIHRGLVDTRPQNEITSPTITAMATLVFGDYESAVLLLGAAVVIVLLIACANIAGLLLASGSTRARHVAIRAALGAGRGRLVRHLLAESLVLALLGGGLGVWLGYGAVQVLGGSLDDLPPWVTFELDVPFLLFALVATGGTAMLCGLIPALDGSRVDLRATLQAAAARSSETPGKRRMLGTLVVGEVALALVLLLLAGLLIKASDRVRQVDPGYRPENVLTYRVSLTDERYPEDAQQLAFFEQLLERSRAVPGVSEVGITTSVPLGGHWGNFYEAEGAPPRAEDDTPVILQRVISSGYLDAIGVRVLAGRPFTDRDGETEGAGAAIINESLMRLFWPGAEPNDVVGRRIRTARIDGQPNESPWQTVLGVTADTQHYGLDTPMRPGLFLPFAQVVRTSMTVVWRTAGDPTALTATARSVVSELDPDLPIYGVTTMAAELDESLAVRQAFSWLLGIFAVVALGLALAGLYGAVSYSVSQRAQEIGIRMALGAQRLQVVGQVLSRGMLLVGAGVLSGLAVAAVSARFLSEFLFGVSAYDPLTYLAVTAALVIVGLLATLVPARRSSAVDPMRVLRVD